MRISLLGRILVIPGGLLVSPRDEFKLLDKG